ncbi:MAG: hypothetical protein J7500_07055 [Sphingomonas sp.]|uniref:hypothetical protein n=1 Tax=Sphingomonas sp. TaxID=28214 RepID=UPI001B2445AA|nr:hypothetical protein [Sphingomonas sp.]MBO9622453.1 hypothetical protein [Sphingomonas sp.]
MEILAGKAPRGAVLTLVALGLLLQLPAPMLPSMDLDPSWMLAVEHAARSGAIFGRDFIFSYGPFGFLASRFYDPQTYAFTLLGDFLLTLLFFVPLLWNRSWAVLAFYLAAIVAVALDRLSIDARFTAALLGIFLWSLRSRRMGPVIATALIAPFFLSKFSYAMAALPYLLLADAYRLLAFRRFPLLTIVAALVVLAGALLTGHTLSMLPALLANIGEIVGGYDGAMQSDFGGIYPMLAAYAAIAVISAALGWLWFRRRDGWNSTERAVALPAPIAAQLESLFLAGAVAWTLFIAFKMGHVRQDLHILNTWFTLVLMTPMLLAYLGAVRPLAKVEQLVFAVLFAGTLVPAAGVNAAIYFHRNGLKPIAYAGQLASRPFETLAWLLPSHWNATTEARRAAERAIANELPSGVRGSVDVIPTEIGPAVLGGAHYQPRPVPQSYSSYTPRLQALDAGHFANPATAPDTVFLKIGDIDNRLPTLATGPTLPVLVRWYDAVATSRLGLVLRHRAAPRKESAIDLGKRAFSLGEWVPVPKAEGATITASIAVDRTLAGRIIAFAGREPMLTITLRYEDGSEAGFRFVPGMARTGFVISPLATDLSPDNLAGAAAMLEPTRAPGAVRRVVAFRIGGSSIAAPAFRADQVAFRAIRFEPGFAAALAR